MSSPDPQKSRAVLIGTSRYQHLPNLEAVTNNLVALQQGLCQEDVWGLAPQHVQIVENPISQSKMLDPLHESAEEAQSVLLVYYAGHGVISRSSDLLLGLPETDDDPSRSIYTAVPYNLLRSVLMGSRAQYRILILDCCFSGRAVGAMGTSNVAAAAETDGAYIMASAPPNKASLAPEGAQFTAFTAELVELIQQGIEDAGRHLTLDEIFSDIRQSMSRKNLPQPWCRDHNDAGALPLLKNRAAVKAGPPPGYGEIPGVEEGDIFASRKELSYQRVHRPLQAGICGRHAAGGAESIVVSGGYSDDHDLGDVIIYTGHGGQDDRGRQVRPQDPSDPGNAALMANITTRYPVRVIRGAGGDRDYSPAEGFRYDGLYSVEEYWTTEGQDGFRIIQFRLEKLPQGEQPVVPSSSMDRRAGINLSHWEPVSAGIYMNRRLAEKVKQAHDYECQICGYSIQTPAGFRFSPTFHLQSLARPHKGPDIPENILCVCLTHRAELELGVITIDDDLSVINENEGIPIATLSLSPKHRVGRQYLRYHRGLYRRQGGTGPHHP
ncbi:MULTISPECIES: caspase, EACC1-associated type [Actinomadura]|uniref:YDG/SRA domain-containing protein n=1 Tax=Actinomadura yumaensis TaxID=111807 RepID=A0ABW2CIM0_9ACTN|nr:YDG/SRA domain-containing protein [Actinomadura sp. J1-007]MWK34713.1 hypothetical protein [Actinomadura sp. J1-007]